MNILTFDIEEWFHILDNYSTKSESDWLNYESRIHRNMEIIFNIIDKHNVRGTFFVVGWIAEKYPEIVKQISDRGFQIGSHTHMHQLVYEQNPKSFLRDVEKSIKTLEDISSQKVELFRAPGFSITEKNIWAFEVLVKLGIKIDCSVFPAGRAHGGFKSYSHATPSIIRYNGVSLKEFPINTHNFFYDMIFSGGGYFRLLPYFLIKKFTKKSDYVMTYFHPRDFDSGQPLIEGLSPLRIFKSYVGIKNCRNKLDKWLEDFNFIDLKSANDLINWNNVKTINLGEQF